jgi:hypothetical protein
MARTFVSFKALARFYYTTFGRYCSYLKIFSKYHATYTLLKRLLKHDF